MVDFIPYFAGIVTIVAGIGFSYAVTNGWNFGEDLND